MVASNNTGLSGTVGSRDQFNYGVNLSYQYQGNETTPICNSSGALVAVLTLLFVGAEDYSPLALFAVALVCVGAIGLGVVDACEDETLRARRQEEGNYKYAKSFLALALPVAYCILDAAGTFADNRVLETLNEDSANVAYELTFLLAAVLSFVYVPSPNTSFTASQRSKSKIRSPSIASSTLLS